MSTSSPRTALFLLGAILLLAFGLRLYRAGTYGVFFDEKATLLVSQGVPASVFDAQMVNLYLPKNAQHIQRIDPAEPDRILFVTGKTSRKITIFNFEGTKYRY